MYDVGAMARRDLNRIIVNVVTLSRFPLAALVLFAGHYNHWAIALVLVVIAFATDWVDGKLARRWKVVSSFGKFFDPLSDKVICLTVLWLGFTHEPNPYLLTCAVIMSLYDTFTTSMRLFIKRGKGVMVGATRLAQVKTFTLMSGLVFLLLGITFEHVSADWVINGTAALLLAVASVLAFRSFWLYLWFSLLGFSLSPVDHVAGIDDIDFAAWHENYGINCLLCDIEGTLSPWKGEEVSEEIIAALQSAQRAGITKLGLITNIRPKEESRVKRIAEVVGADIYCLPRNSKQRKPHSFMLTKAMNHLQVTPEQTAVIGDKFVDVMAGRRAGVVRIGWVERLGSVDHPFDRLVYRRAEPFLKWLTSN